jgi:CheY-like chemotaxis protein
LASIQLSKGRDPAEVSQSLKRALSVFDRARHLTKQLLTFSKGGIPDKRATQLSDLLADNVTFALSGASVRSAFEISDDLWLCDVDPHQMGQVIDNLILNARQAMPEGGTITITADNVVGADSLPRALALGRYIRVAIRDEGEGIPEENLQRIFDPFFSTKKSGSGLGLSTCYSIIHRHGGAIEVHSSLGKGTTFTLYLPASRKKRPSIPPQGTKGHQGNGRALVMDDEPHLRDLCAMMLEQLGYDADKAEDGREALQLFDEAVASGSPYELLLLDLTVPGGMGGKQAVALLRDRHIPFRAVAVSGYSEDAVMVSPREHGFDASLTKPYRTEDLAEVLSAVFSDSHELRTTVTP